MGIGASYDPKGIDGLHKENGELNEAGKYFQRNVSMANVFKIILIIAAVCIVVFIAIKVTQRHTASKLGKAEKQEAAAPPPLPPRRPASPSRSASSE